MASLLAFASAVGHGINPFDGGQGYTNKAPVQKKKPLPAQQIAGPAIGINRGQIGGLNPGARPQAPAPRPVIDFHTAPVAPPKSPVVAPKGVSIIPPAGKPGPLLNNNSPVKLGAVAPKAPLLNRPTAPYQTPGIVNQVIRPVLQAGPNIGVSVADQVLPGKQTLTPPHILQPLIGKDAVKSYQQRAAGNKQVLQKSNNSALRTLAIPLAGLGAIASAAGDVTAAIPAGKGASTGAEAAIKIPEAIKSDASQASKELKAVLGGTRAPKQGLARIKSMADVPTAKPDTKADHWYDAIRTVTGRLNNMGGTATDVAKGLDQRREMAETLTAGAKNRSRTITTLNKKQQAEAVDVLQGTTTTTNPKVKQASVEMGKELTTAYHTARRSGANLKFRQNYFPHFTQVPEKNSSGYQGAIDHLIKTKQAKTPNDAAQLLEYSRKGTHGARKFGNFENSRNADLPDYPKTAEAYHHYLDEAYHQVAHNKVFGVPGKNSPQGKIFDGMINKIASEGGDIGKVRSLFAEANRTQTDAKTERIANLATGFQGATKLGTSFIANAGQQVNNMVAGGVGNTLKNLAKVTANAATKGKAASESADFIRRTGVTGEQVAREGLESRTGFGGERMRKVTAPFFEPIEKGNRATGALVGRDRARALTEQLTKARQAGKADKATKLNIKLREEFNVSGKVGNKLTKPQEIQAARKFVDRTQFRTAAQDLPAGSTNPLGRVVTQFKRYPYKQTQFIGREILKPASKGNLLPLARAGGVGLPIGYGVNALRDKISGQDTSSDSLTTKLLGAAGSGGVTGLETSVAKGVNPYGVYDGDAYLKKLASTLGGPSVGDAAKLGGGAFNAATGKTSGDPSRYTALERLGIQHIPDVGNPLANRVVPYAGSKTGSNAVLPKDKLNGASVAQINASDSAEVKKFKETNAGQYGLTQTASGKYIYKVGNKVETTDDIGKARDAIRKDAFNQSGEPYQIIPDAKGADGTVLRRGPDGKISESTKTKFDYQLGTATLTAQKNNDDITGYLKTAHSQLDSIAKQLKDPSIDPLDALTLQNTASTLQKNIDKYTSYGGFTKPKSGNSRGDGSSSSNSFLTTGFKTASSSKAPSVPKGISVKTPVSKRSAGVKKLSTAKIPSSYTTRRLG